MDLLKMLILIDMLSEVADEDPETFKEAVTEADKESDTDIKCEIEKLRKERAEKLKELNEIKSNIEAIELLLARLEKLESKINK